MTCTEKIEIELISHSIKLIALPNTMKVWKADLIF